MYKKFCLWLIIGCAYSGSLLNYPSSLSIVDVKSDNKKYLSSNRIGFWKDIHGLQSSNEYFQKKELEVNVWLKKYLKNFLIQEDSVLVIEISEKNAHGIKELIKEGNTEILQNQSLLLQFSPLVESKSIYAKHFSIVPADWRGTVVDKLYRDWVLYIIDEIEKFQKDLLKKLRTLNQMNEVKKIQDQGTEEFFSMIFSKEERKGLAENAKLKDIQTDFDTFIKLISSCDKCKVTVKEFSDQIKKSMDLIAQHKAFAPIEAKNLLNVYEQLSDRAKKIIELNENNTNKPYIWCEVQSAVNKQSGGSLWRVFEKLRKANVKLADFGFIVTIEKAREKYPFILVATGETHGKALLKKYINNEGSKEVYQVQGEKELDPVDEKYVKKFFELMKPKEE